jgi:hypothetical protein
MNTKKYIGILSIAFALTVFASVSAAECTIETLNDPTICDEAGLNKLLAS